MKLLIVDDHVLFRQGLALLVNELDSDIQFTEVGSCREALALDRNEDITLILLDLHLPGEKPLELLEELVESFQAPVVMLSSEDDTNIVRLCIESGAAGFVPKSSTPQVLIAAMQLILAGGTYLPPNVLSSAASVDRLRKEPLKEKTYLSSAPCASTEIMEKLSKRQTQVLIRAVQGKSNKVIARELDLSEGTVKAHMSSAYRALGVKNRTEAVYLAAKYGLGTSLD